MECSPVNGRRFPSGFDGRVGTALIRDPECSTGAPNRRARRSAWSSRSDGSEGRPPRSSAPRSAWTWRWCTRPYAPATRRYLRGHRSEKSDRPRNRRRSLPEPSVQLRADDRDGDAPALGVLRDPQGFADTAAGSRRGRCVASQLHSCACSALGCGRRSDRPQTGCRTDGTTGDGQHRRSGHARMISRRS